MTTVLNPPQLGAEERFVLRNVTWETYEHLLKNYESFSAPRFTYDQGDLEIMSPSIPYEAASRILSLLVNIICEEREIDVKENKYIVLTNSAELPGITSENITQFVNASVSTKRPQWLRQVRQWIRSIDQA